MPPGRPLKTSPHPGLRQDWSKSVALCHGVHVVPSSELSIARWNQLFSLESRNTLPVTLSTTGVGCWHVCSSDVLRLPSLPSVLLRQIICNGPQVLPSSVERRRAMSVHPARPSPVLTAGTASGLSLMVLSLPCSLAWQNASSDPVGDIVSAGIPKL